MNLTSQFGHCSAYTTTVIWLEVPFLFKIFVAICGNLYALYVIFYLNHAGLIKNNL